MIFTNKGKRWL